MNIKTKIILIITMLMLVIFNSNVCFADTIQSFDIWEVGKEFIDLGIEQNDGDISIDNKAKQQFQYIIDFLWGIGLLTIFICSIVLGIKYMLVLPNEKSRIKQATYPYVIGVVIIFGALTIWKFLINFLDGNL